jgi:hypothetical protein
MVVNIAFSIADAKKRFIGPRLTPRRTAEVRHPGSAVFSQEESSKGCAQWH